MVYSVCRTIHFHDGIGEKPFTGNPSKNYYTNMDLSAGVHYVIYTRNISINIERVGKHSVTILRIRVVTPAGIEPG